LKEGSQLRSFDDSQMELYLNSEEPKLGTEFIKYLNDNNFNDYLKNDKIGAIYTAEQILEDNGITNFHIAGIDLRNSVRIWHVFERY